MEAQTLKDLRTTMAEQLGSLSANPDHEAERWLCRALGLSRAGLYSRLGEAAPPDLLPPDEWQRRLQGEPLAYIWGRADFWGLELEVSADVLIPRPDTEVLVEQALALTLPATARVLDLGTGSGAIAVALASERPAWQITGCDRSSAALAVAQRNVERYAPGVQLVQSDWYQSLADEPAWNLIVANPPYIATGDPHLADLSHEPESALVAADGGLADLTAIVAGAGLHLAHGGHLLVEHGFDQAAAVRALLGTAGFKQINSHRDLGGHERCTGGRCA